MSTISGSLGGLPLAFHGPCGTGKTIAQRGLAREALAARHRPLTVTDRGVGLAVVGHTKPVRVPMTPWWEPVA